MKKFHILCSLIFIGSITFGQAPVVNTAMITCFSQGHAHSGATNCASVSAIKLAITKYGTKGVFANIDTLPNKYIVHLRNGHQTEITQAEIDTMENLNKFYSLKNNDTVKAAKFMYAVMAKNKYTNPAKHYESLTKAATDKKRILFVPYETIYQLQEDTWDNFALLGLDLTKIQKIDATNVQNYSDIVITSNVHSVLLSYNTYDEYGTPTSFPIFTRKHGRINQNMNYILID